MQLGPLFWWNLWMVVSAVIVIGVVVLLVMFIRWGRRRQLSGDSLAGPRNPE